MAVNSHAVLKAFSPRILVKALLTLDRATAIVVGSAWLAALAVLIIAMFSVSNALSAKKLAADAQAVEPILPIATTSRINQNDASVLVERLQRQFPDIKIEADGSQTIILKTSDASKFHQWVSALSFVDAMSPQLRWIMQGFCVGSCGQGDLMRAAVVGQRVKFALPPQSEKNAAH
jgi:hypothetical protein